MIRTLTALALLSCATPALAQASAAIASGKVAPSALSPGEIVAAAPKAEWVTIAPRDLLVMDLAPDLKGKPRRVVIQLMPPPFSQGWIGNIRKLAAAHWWDGLSINRVQDNYVVQGGDADGEDKAKARPLVQGLASPTEAEYRSAPTGRLTLLSPLPSDMRESGGRGFRLDKSAALLPHSPDPYAARVGFAGSFPVGVSLKTVVRAPKTAMTSVASLGEAVEFAWPVHCYGMVGVGRDLSPNTGSGAELYTVIGHAPRHLDRNIALVGRVIEGIEHLSSLPRGTGALGFYETPAERTPIVSIRLGNEVAGLPAYEYLSTESATFARYADARANRRDPFFIVPAGGADICHIPVPVRRAK
jgi:peptidylprolyl isomerase